MTKAIDVLRAHQSREKSKWREQAQWHIDNWDWLKHSSQIALSAKSMMISLGLSQKELAERMGCTQQFVSLILKGKENLTLETISKLERVLGADLLIHPQYHIEEFPPVYLNDSDGGTSDAGIRTGSLVDGYKPKKN